MRGRCKISETCSQVRASFLVIFSCVNSTPTPAVNSRRMTVCPSSFFSFRNRLPTSASLRLTLPPSYTIRNRTPQCPRRTLSFELHFHALVRNSFSCRHNLKPAHRISDKSLANKSACNSRRQKNLAPATGKESDTSLQTNQSLASHSLVLGAQEARMDTHSEDCHCSHDATVVGRGELVEDGAAVALCWTSLWWHCGGFLCVGSDL